MSELTELLAERLETEPRRPSDPELGPGISATAYWSFDPSLEIVVAEAANPPADGAARAAWKKRLGRRPIPLILLIESGENGALVIGPGGDPPPAVNLDPRLIAAELAAAAELDPLDVRRRLPEAFQRARGAGGLSGLRTSAFSRPTICAYGHRSSRAGRSWASRAVRRRGRRTCRSG